MNEKKILVVDDSEYFVELLKVFLKRTGCLVLTSTDAREALEIVETEKPDLILLDLKMPCMNGEEFCKNIRSNPDSEKIPIILITGALNLIDDDRCAQLGCNDFMTKPVNRIELLKRIKKYVPISARTYVRAPIVTMATYSKGKNNFSGNVFSISEGGLFISGEEILCVGEKIKVNFSIENIEASIEADGEIVWNTKERRDASTTMPPGMGVKFTTIKENYKIAIRRYVNAGDYIG